MQRARRHRTSRRQGGEQGNPAVRAAVLEIVDNQLRENDPPEVRLTLERLVSSGLSDEMARLHIGMVVLFEMNDILRTNAPFDRDRYISALNRLPNIS